jgi:hypothetical protein
MDGLPDDRSLMPDRYGIPPACYDNAAIINRGRNNISTCKDQPARTSPERLPTHDTISSPAGESVCLTFHRWTRLAQRF